LITGRVDRGFVGDLTAREIYVAALRTVLDDPLLVKTASWCSREYQRLASLNTLHPPRYSPNQDESNYQGYDQQQWMGKDADYQACDEEQQMCEETSCQAHDGNQRMDEGTNYF
jgi:hypothetical protein